jgi:predicted ATPase
MPRYILTGTPGAGKTALLRALEVRGHAVVEEAATDVIALEHARGVAEHWKEPAFVDRVHALQLARMARAVAPIQVHDRSPACTVALARQLKHPEPAIDMSPFEKTVFFVRNLGRIENTEARRISFEDALVFEKIHEDVYRERGFDLVEIAPAPVEARADIVERYLRLAGGM